MSIATIMSVCGDMQYFKFSDYSISSFLRNNPGADLFVFTDNLDYFDNKYKNKKVTFINYNEVIFLIKYVAEKIESETISVMKNLDNHGRAHVHKFVSNLLPLGQHWLKEMGYSHILKIDCDSYFVGDLISSVESTINKKYDLHVVKREHHAMVVKDHPFYYIGVGFTLWKISGSFINKYINNFYMDEQRTIAYKLVYENAINYEILDYPGYHFVYPFCKNPEFSKEDAEEFNPCYFHLGDKNVLNNLKKLESWFNG